MQNNKILRRLLGIIMGDMLNKYPGVLEPYVKELFSKKVGESISIPYSAIRTLLSDQEGDYRDVTRRAFRQYIKEYTKMDDPSAGKPSFMNKLVEFANGNNCIIVTKKGQL